MIAKFRIRRPTFCLILLGISSDIRAQVSNLQFEHFTLKDGLSSNVVRCMVQDSVGFMWFGTTDGLNKYDGYTFTIYRSIAGDSSSLSSNWIGAIQEDSEGQLWVAANNTLHRYQRDLNKFIRYPPDSSNPYRPRGGVNVLYRGSQGVMWVGGNRGLDRYDPRTGVFTRVNTVPMSVRSIAEDRRGNLWLAAQIGVEVSSLVKLNTTTLQIESSQTPLFAERFGSVPDSLVSILWVDSHTATGKHAMAINSVFADSCVWITSGIGLFRLDPATNQFKHVSRGASSQMCVDSAGRLWLGTYNSLRLVDPVSLAVSKIQHSSSDPKSISSSSVRKIHADRQGNLWIGTAAGLDLLSAWRKPFKLFDHNSEGPQTIGEGMVYSIMEDSHENRWVATWGGGLTRWNLRTGQFMDYDKTPLNSWVRVVYEDRTRTVWGGGSTADGLVRFSSGKDSYSKELLDSDTRNVNRNSVRSIFEDSYGVFWVGTSAGLCRYDRATKEKHWYAEVVFAIYEDHTRNLWMSTYGGFLQYERESDTFINRGPRDVYAIFEDRNSRLWLGTSEGLVLFDRTSNTRIPKLTEKNGLAGREVFGLLEDGTGNLWLSTDVGLTKYNPGSGNVRNYGIHDGYPFKGIESTAGGYHAFWLRKNGEMMFGVGNGYVVFHPDGIRDNPHVPSIVLTDFRLFDESVGIGSGSVLQKSIALTQDLFLTHEQNSISFEFVALDFTSPAKNQYAYMMEGFDRDWIYSGTRRYASYTHLDPGEYTFRVKGSNNDGVWNENGTFVRITIAPPWWKTMWAYLGYGLVIGTVLYTIRRSEKHRDRLRHQAELEHTRAESLLEVDQLKSRFFANISHEFRTPLTLIKGPLEGMLAAENDGGKKQHLSMMHRNADRLLRLVNQLLDLSKLESGAMKLQASCGNIVSFVKGIASSFESSAGLRSITIAIETDADEIQAYFDRDKLEKILTNLLSNAFKFTPDGGEVKTSVQRIPDPPRIAITVSDTGIGIPGEELPRVFDRFYQVDSSQTREHEGSGIGLALTKELVELHHGTISVKSEVGKGTEFTVSLPLGREHLRDDEVVGAEEIEGEEVRRVPVVATQASPLRAKEEKGTVDTSLPLVLIVEDNADVRAYMREYLVKSYQVIEAHDGAEGIGRAMEAIPDLIISDVMMPKQDGYEVCKALKLDEKTSHIPIILLTARAGTESKIEGLETGADDYLTKPFDAKELLARVKNLIETRRKLRERFSTAKPLKPGEVAVTSMDDTFLQKAKAIVEAHIGEEEFGVEEFAGEMSMSRSQLLRKLTALTGLPVRDFIRYIRLHRAMDLLRQKAGTVAEIGYSVGFGSPAYFSKCFHEQFGIVPSDVQNQT